MFDEDIRLYELISGTWNRIVYADGIVNLGLDIKTPQAMTGQAEDNITVFKLTNGRVVHHVPAYPMGEWPMTFSYGWVNLLETYKWIGMIGTRIRIRRIHWTDAKRTLFRTETFEALVKTVNPTPLAQSVPQLFNIDMNFAVKEYNNQYLPTISDEYSASSEWGNIDNFGWL